MFKLFETHEEKPHHYLELIENEDYTAIIEKMQEGLIMDAKEKSAFDTLIIDKIQNDGVMFLSDLYKEGYDISDEWLLRWTKTKKFITNYNLPVYGYEYFKERLENIAPEILNYYMERMDNLAMSVSHSYRVGFIQAVEVLMSVRNYSKIIEHIEGGIPDTKLLQYIQKIKILNKTIEENPSFYKEMEDNLKVSDFLKELQEIMEKRHILKKDTKQSILPDILKQCIARIHNNYNKCIENKEYLKEDTLDILKKINDEKIVFLLNTYKENKDQEILSKELIKIETAITSVLIGINRKKVIDIKANGIMTSSLKLK